MDNDSIRDYLKIIMAAVADDSTGAEIVESEDGPMLLCTAASPFEKDAEICYQFSLTPADSGIVVVEVIIFLFSNIDSDKLSGVNTLIAKLNPYISLGSLRLFEEGNTVMFIQGALTDEQFDISSVTETLGKTVSIMENTSYNAGKYIYRYLNGEELEKLLDEIDKEE